MSHDMTKPTKWVCAQPRLRSAWASAQSDQSSLCAQWVPKDPSFLHADSEDSDQNGRTPRLIWVFAGRTLILSVLSCRGSNNCFSSNHTIVNTERRQSLKSLSTASRELHRLAKGLALSVAYAANVGGIATLTGTPPNLVLKNNADE